MTRYVTTGRSNHTLQSIVKKAIRKNSDGKVLLTLSQSGTGELCLKPLTVEGLLKSTVHEENGVVNFKAGKHG